MLAFLQQNLATIIIGAILLALLVLAVRHLIRKTLRGDCGCSGCSGCSGCHVGANRAEVKK